MVIIDPVQIADFYVGSRKNPYALYGGDNGGIYTSCQSDIDGTMKHYALVSIPGVHTGTEGSNYKLYSSADGITWTLIHTSAGTRTNVDYFEFGVFIIGPGIIQEIKSGSTRYLICTYAEYVNSTNWDITSRVYTSGSGWSTITNKSGETKPLRPLDICKVSSYSIKVICFDDVFGHPWGNTRMTCYEPLTPNSTIWDMLPSTNNIAGGFTSGDYYYFINIEAGNFIYRWDGDTSGYATSWKSLPGIYYGIGVERENNNLLYANSLNGNWYIFTTYEVWVLESIENWNWRKYIIAGAKTPAQTSFIWKRIPYDADISTNGNHYLEFFVSQWDGQHVGTVGMDEGFDWGTTNQKFSIDYNGAGSPTTVTLNSLTTDVATTVTEINNELATAGLSTDMEAFAYYIYVGLRLKSTSTKGSFTLAGVSPSALGTLGWTAGTYTKEYDIYKIGNTLFKFEAEDFTVSRTLQTSGCDSWIYADDGTTNGMVYELQLIPYEAISCGIETGYGDPPEGIISSRSEIIEDEYHYFYDRNDIFVMQGFLKNVSTFGRKFFSDIISPLIWDFEQLVTENYSSTKASDILKDVIDKYCSNIWYDSNSIPDTSANRAPDFRRSKFRRVIDWAEKAEHSIFYITPDFKAHFNDGTRKSGTINYTSQTANFTVGIIIKGGTSNATGIVIRDVDAGTTGTLTLTSVFGTFQNSETITDEWGGSATTSSTLFQTSLVLGTDTIIAPKKRVKHLSPSYVYALGGFADGDRVIGFAQQDQVLGGSSLYCSYPVIVNEAELDLLAAKRLEAAKDGIVKMNFAQRKYGLIQYGQSMNFGFDNAPFNITEGSFYVMGCIFELVQNLGELIIYDALDYPSKKDTEGVDDRGVNPETNQELIQQNAKDIYDLSGGAVTFGSPTGNIDIGDTAVEGSSTDATRADHQHQFSAPGAGYPVDVAATEVDGSASTPARADHVHAHGSGYSEDAHHNKTHNNTEHSTNYHTEADGTGVATVHSDITNTGSQSIITTAERNNLHVESHTLASHSTKLFSDLSDIDTDLSTVVKSMETVGTGSYPASPKEGQIYWDADDCMLVRWNVVAQAWIEIGGGAGLVGGNSLYRLLSDSVSMVGLAKATPVPCILMGGSNNSYYRVFLGMATNMGADDFHLTWSVSLPTNIDGKTLRINKIFVGIKADSSDYLTSTVLYGWSDHDSESVFFSDPTNKDYSHEVEYSGGSFPYNLGGSKSAHIKTYASVTTAGEFGVSYVLAECYYA